MFNIKYNNGCFNHKVTFYRPFVRLDSCNAAWYEVTKADNQHNALKHDILTGHYGFVSYSTPICYISYHLDRDTNRDYYHIFVNKDSYRCSSATIHQFVRFLRKVMGNLLSYHDIKAWELTGLKSVNVRDCFSYSLHFTDSAELTARMATDDARFYDRAMI